MNLSSISFHVYKEVKPISIDIFITDSDEIIQEKIIHAIEPRFPSFVLFPKNFEMKKLLEKSETFTFLNLFSLPSLFTLKPYEKVIDINFKLLNDVLENYDIKKNALFELVLFRLYFSESYVTRFIKMTEKKKKTKLPSVAPSTAKKVRPKPETVKAVDKPTKEGTTDIKVVTGDKPPPAPPTLIKVKAKPPVVRAPKEVDVVFPSSLETVTKLVDRYEKHPDYALTGIQSNLLIRSTILLLRKKLEVNNLEWKFKWVFNRNKNLFVKIETDLNLSDSYHEKFTAIVPLETTSLEETGKVVFLEVDTQQTSTGMIFDQLRLSDSLPVAKYKDFYKILRKC